MTGVFGGEGSGKSSGFAAAFSTPYIIRNRVIPNVVRNLPLLSNYQIIRSF